jgi:hypothetical protein
MISLPPVTLPSIREGRIGFFQLSYSVLLPFKPKIPSKFRINSE